MRTNFMVMALVGFGVLGGCADSSTVETTTDEEEAALIDPVEAAKVQIGGTWRVEFPRERMARRFKIIEAALSAEPLREQNLGKLSKDEKDLYETWSRKKGREVRKMKRKLNMAKARYVFAEGQVTVQVQDGDRREFFGPVAVDVLGTAPNRTELRFDPGMGNGFETHLLLWSGNDRATDKVTANGEQVIELEWVRESGPPAPTPPAD